MSRPKNLLFIWTDQQRPDTIGAYTPRRIFRGAHQAPSTPNLDRLAATGTLFENAYCAQPVCSPSRASVLTGVFPHTHGVTQNNIPLSPHWPTLAERLRPHGYACGYVGKWHLGNEMGLQPPHGAGRRGFEEFWSPTEDGYTQSHAREGYSAYHRFLVEQGRTPPNEDGDGRIFSRSTAAALPEALGKPAFMAGEAMRFLDEHGSDRPFFLMVNFLEPHTPFTGPLDDMYDPADMALPESWYAPLDQTVPLRFRRQRDEHRGPVRGDPSNPRTWQEVKARYHGLVTLVDRHVGRILDRVDALGLSRDTVVVHSTDHGEMMGEHGLVTKSVPFEGAVHVPLIVRAAYTGTEVVAPRRVRTPVSLTSLPATLLDLLGQDAPDYVQAPSLAPLVRDGDTAPDAAEVVVEWNGRSGFLADPHPDDSLDDVRRLITTESRTIRRGRWKLTLHASGEHELYDLKADPGETHNAVGDRRARRTAAELDERLRAWQRRTGDTLTLPDLVPLGGGF